MYSYEDRMRAVELYIKLGPQKSRHSALFLLFGLKSDRLAPKLIGKNGMSFAGGRCCHCRQHGGCGH